MVNIEIDGIPLKVDSAKMIIQAADEAGIDIPRFCYHKKLSIAANCRMCLVEVDKSRKALPKMLPGTVHEQFVRCGKPNCRCRRGPLHGPYYYHFRREAGRLKKEYIPRDAVDDVRSRCETRQRYQRALRE